MMLTASSRVPIPITAILAAIRGRNAYMNSGYRIISTTPSNSDPRYPSNEMNESAGNRKRAIPSILINSGK